MFGNPVSVHPTPKEPEMKGVLIAVALLAASGQSSAPGVSSDMECSHYVAMKADGQTAMVDSMRSRLPMASKMPSSHEMAKTVWARCKEHPRMMVHDAMNKEMPH